MELEVGHSIIHWSITIVLVGVIISGFYIGRGCKYLAKVNENLIYRLEAQDMCISILDRNLKDLIQRNDLITEEPPSRDVEAVRRKNDYLTHEQVFGKDS